MLVLVLAACLVDKALYEARKAELHDDDGDGWSEVDGDCADDDGAVHPSAGETCDGRDEDCDGSVDEDPSAGPSWWPDADGDEFGSDEVAPTVSCDALDGHVEQAGDCDDA